MKRVVLVAMAAPLLISATAPQSQTSRLTRTCAALRSAATQLERDGHYLTARDAIERNHVAVAKEAAEAVPADPVLHGFATAVQRDAEQAALLEKRAATDNLTLASTLRQEAQEVC